jgi:hypothetical protein
VRVIYFIVVALGLLDFCVSQSCLIRINRIDIKIKALAAWLWALCPFFICVFSFDDGTRLFNYFTLCAFVVCDVIQSSADAS